MPAGPSIAEELFRKIMTHDGHENSVDYLRSMVNSQPPTVETEYLDFKSASREGTAVSDGEVKKTWSEALAGFATTGGGVLIWGIDARKSAGDSVDQACGFNLVLDPYGLKSRLQQLHHQATDPPVPGVRIEAFPDSDADGQGFVVCYVPESDYKPHRSEASGKRWVMRVGDSFVDVPPPVLRNLFFPQRRSYIFFRAGATTKIWVDNAQIYRSSTKYEFRLYNEGPATADRLVLRFKKVQGVSFAALSPWKNTPSVIGWRLLYPEPVHAGDMLQVCEATISYPIGSENLQAVSAPYETEFEVEIYSTDQVPQSCRLLFTPDDIRSDRTVDGLPVPLATDRFR